MRKKIIFFGNVQGIGFRMTTAKLAKQLALNGWVRNNPDGSVTLVLEGKSERIDLIKQKLQTIFQDYITQLKETEEPEKGITDFRILY